MPGPKRNARQNSHGGKNAERKGRLSENERADILRRLQAGEKASDLAREFGVSRQAVSLLKLKTAATKSRPRLVDSEIQKLHQVATTTLPSAHGFKSQGPWYDVWTGVSLHRLAEKIAKRRLMHLPIRRLFHEWFGYAGTGPVRTYHPDVPRSLATIPQEMRDADFLRFLRERKGTASTAKPSKASAATSPAFKASQPTKRGRPRRGDSLMPPPEAWEFLNPADLRSVLGKEATTAASKVEVSPPVRTGKHRKSKGTPFPAARKKKKKMR